MEVRLMDLKKMAAQEALALVESGMTIGLGSGSTTGVFIDLLGQKVQSGALEGLLAVPTSESTAQQARRLGIGLTSLAETAWLDLVVDGADEVDPQLDLIKGLGQALLREKIVEVHTQRFVVIVDESKLVPRLGTKAPLPVEIVRFEAQAHLRWLNSLDCRAELWLEPDGAPVVTDNGNYLARCWFADGISDAYQLAMVLQARPGIVEHGLFLEMASQVIIAGREGVRLMERDI
jgi:ribose 5-phosphate isomerase A